MDLPRSQGVSEQQMDVSTILHLLLDEISKLTARMQNLEELAHKSLQQSSRSNPTPTTTIRLNVDNRRDRAKLRQLDGWTTCQTLKHGEEFADLTGVKMKGNSLNLFFSNTGIVDQLEPVPGSVSKLLDLSGGVSILPTLYYFQSFKAYSQLNSKNISSRLHGWHAMGSEDSEGQTLELTVDKAMSKCKRIIIGLRYIEEAHWVCYSKKIMFGGLELDFGCGKCAGSHRHKQCRGPIEPRCPNCVDQNEAKSEVKISTGHSAFHSSCLCDATKSMRDACTSASKIPLPWLPGENVKVKFPSRRNGNVLDNSLPDASSYGQPPIGTPRAELTPGAGTPYARSGPDAEQDPGLNVTTSSSRQPTSMTFQANLQQIGGQPSKQLTHDVAGNMDRSASTTFAAAGSSTEQPLNMDLDVTPPQPGRSPSSDKPKKSSGATSSSSSTMRRSSTATDDHGQSPEGTEMNITGRGRQGPQRSSRPVLDADGPAAKQLSITSVEQPTRSPSPEKRKNISSSPRSKSPLKRPRHHPITLDKDVPPLNGEQDISQNHVIDSHEPFEATPSSPTFEQPLPANLAFTAGITSAIPSIEHGTEKLPSQNAFKVLKDTPDSKCAIKRSYNVNPHKNANASGQISILNFFKPSSSPPSTPSALRQSSSTAIVFATDVSQVSVGDGEREMATTGSMGELEASDPVGMWDESDESLQSVLFPGSDDESLERD
ncbi:hypothetical protein CSIM01_05251 [Colletotrichum simmondsii]|uniref:Uncharacterized protein n=1 Tax=Colletotrichum simmondsii TaxID=703756 RepID=A0A135SB31_9PEZI|nr:hypothetical protein CSIM01_05251 [Colletotrichum simmondsii]